MKMKSNMEHSFSQVPTQSIQRSSFQRNFTHKTTFDADGLIPILVDDIIPGDTFNVNCNFVARLASPTLLPLMDNMFLDTFFFFVPYRLIWDNWEKFCGAQVDPGDSIDFTIPILSGANDTDPQEVADYMGCGIPTNAPTLTELGVSAMPFRAYRLIWNEWFRDQNMQDTLVVQTDDGPDSTAESGSQGPVFRRGKRHDYFTSALPWPQKGTAVAIPLGVVAPVVSTGVAPTFVVGAGSPAAMHQNLSDTANIWGTQPTVTGTPFFVTTGLEADLTGATTVSINDIRLAFQTQKLLERDARSGTRYVETLKAHWGVTVPDFRLQRPEFLGGGSSRVNVSPVAQTTYQSVQTIEDAKGALGGIGIVSGSHGFTKSFVEHGVVLGLANVRGDITYSQGIDRYWHKQTRYDFYYPVLAQIGEQSILNKEIYWSGDANDDLVFGYQERYAEYRYKNSQLSGFMRVDAVNTLEVFHLSENFTSLPTLGSTFIESSLTTPLDRAITVPSQPQFIADFFFEMKCARPLPMFGVPGNLDRF